MSIIESNLDKIVDGIISSDDDKSLHYSDQCKFDFVLDNQLSFEVVSKKEFHSHEEAYEFYKAYVKTLGFGISKIASRRSKTHEHFINAKFACTKYGNKRPSTAENPRPCMKCDCKALMHVKRRTDDMWYVHKFVDDHNHDLLPDFPQHFPCHRNLSTVDKITINTLHSLSFPPNKILATLANSYGGLENVNYDEKDVRNYIDKQRRIDMQFGDANLVLELFISMQQEDPNLFYAIDLDENQRLKSVFWVNGKGREDYKKFRDVVSYDTTYITNKFKMSFSPFIRVNNHYQSTILGCALLSDETVNTFIWVMKTWLRAMDGEAPNVILTN
ncbi:hypothetical protein RND81_04G109600 [Saponaria officinalis]|uniref:Protein FAR1-RELATED SEQUENCE n=1 Tax=Saponaria officinalis TaxID=3572 RepID=A0AAW1LKS8_SAPOF